MSEDVNVLIQRLRGEYRIPITDGLGPVGGSEPNNPNEFVRHFETPPIQHEAATLIEQQAARIAELEERANYVSFSNQPLRGERMYGVKDIGSILARAEAAEAEVKRLREALEFYANPEIYKPHPHGSAFDKRHTLCFVAEAALAAQESRHD